MAPLHLTCGALPPVAHIEKKARGAYTTLTVAGIAENIMASPSAGVFVSLPSGRSALCVHSFARAMASVTLCEERDGDRDSNSNRSHSMLRSSANWAALLAGGIVRQELPLDGTVVVVADGSKLNPKCEDVISAIRSRFEGQPKLLAEAAALGIFVSPPPADVEPWLRSLDKWFAEALLAPRLDRAGLLDAVATFHNSFVFLHPMIDLNGRTARALCSYVLWCHGLPPLVVDDYAAYNAAVAADSRVRGVCPGAGFEPAPHAHFLAYLGARLDAAAAPDADCWVCGKATPASASNERCHCGATVVCGADCRKRFAQMGHGAMCAAVALFARAGGYRLSD